MTDLIERLKAGIATGGPYTPWGQTLLDAVGEITRLKRDLAIANAETVRIQDELGALLHWTERKLRDVEEYTRRATSVGQWAVDIRQIIHSVESHPDAEHAPEARDVL